MRYSWFHYPKYIQNNNTNEFGQLLNLSLQWLHTDTIRNWTDSELYLPRSSLSLSRRVFLSFRSPLRVASSWAICNFNCFSLARYCLSRSASNALGRQYTMENQLSINLSIQWSAGQMPVKTPEDQSQFLSKRSCWLAQFYRASLFHLKYGLVKKLTD